MPITIPTVSYDGTNPDPVEWANDNVKPAIEGLDTRLIDVESNLPGTVYFEAEAASGGTLSSGAFVTYPINSVILNIGGGSFNPVTYIYTIPVTGLYDCQATVRMSDGDSIRSLGVGIGVSNADGSWFHWAPTGKAPEDGGYGNRNARQYRRVTRFDAGQEVRLYIYSDGLTFNVNAGNLMIMRLGD